MVKTASTVLAALSAGVAVVHALPVEDGSRFSDPFAVLDPQNRVTPEDSEVNQKVILLELNAGTEKSSDMG